VTQENDGDIVLDKSSVQTQVILEVPGMSYYLVSKACWVIGGEF
jgi:hypothetical protein